MVDMKTCTTCKITKPLECFSKNKNKKHGHQNKCKDCFKLYRNNNKEKLSLLQKEWREKNKEHAKEYMRDYMKKWISDNKEKYFVVQGQDIEDAKKTFLQENYKIDKVKQIKPYHLGIK